MLPKARMDYLFYDRTVYLYYTNISIVVSAIILAVLYVF
jgi:hypothetical protein